LRGLVLRGRLMWVLDLRIDALLVAWAGGKRPSGVAAWWGK